jgi:glycosyltransferase involved in cell wall biosynthesis
MTGLNDPIRVSVVVPTYNGSRFLEETLDSLGGQTVPLHEVVVVDDGSTDGSEHIARHHPAVTRVLRQPHLGVAYARNTGVAHATGSHIALLDQDDLWGPSRHERIIRFLTSNPGQKALVTTCTGFYRQSDQEALQQRGDRLHRGNDGLADDVAATSLAPSDDGAIPPVLRPLSRSELLAGPPSVTVSYVIERQLFQAAGGCTPFARSFDDWVMLLDVSLAADVLLVDEPSLLYRIHSGSTTMHTSWQLPLLTATAALRHGGNVVPPGQARNEPAAPPLCDDRRFFWDQLRTMAGSTGGTLDALAIAQLVGHPSERRRLARDILGSRARSVLGRLRAGRKRP